MWRELFKASERSSHEKVQPIILHFYKYWLSALPSRSCPHSNERRQGLCHHQPQANSPLSGGLFPLYHRRHHHRLHRAHYLAPPPRAKAQLPPERKSLNYLSLNYLSGLIYSRGYTRFKLTVGLEV